MRDALVLGCVLGLSSTSLGCALATGNVQGGEPLIDASTTVSISTGGEGGTTTLPTTNNTAANCQPGAMNGGTTWTDLYTCYFGPTGPDSCAGSPGNCHGTGGAGAQAAWLCGETSASCYMGMVAYSTLDPPAGKSDPTSSGLYMVLCQVNDAGVMTGVMPEFCPTSAWLYPADMARIAAWIAAGATYP